MVKTAVLLPAGAKVQPEEVLVDNYENIQSIVGGTFDVVRYDGSYDDKPVALCGYVNDEGLLNGLEINYLATMLFKQQIVGPCLVTYALSPNGVYDGDDYDMPSELITFLTNDLLLATANAYNEAALMTFATERMVADGTLTEEDIDFMTSQMDDVVNGVIPSLDPDAEMMVLMVRDYLERLEDKMKDRVMDAVKDVVKEMMEEDNDGK